MGSMTYDMPKGQERHVVQHGGATLDGAPIAYVVVLAAVCTALAFIPFSVIVALGSSFPLSQAVFPLVGWILGPVAGAVASGIGALVGVFVAPHTAGVPIVRVVGGVVASFAAGSMMRGGKRSWWWLPITTGGMVALALFPGRAIVENGVSVWAATGASFINWSALLIFALPTRRLIVRWLSNADLRLVALGLGLGTWTAAGLAHLVQGAITYYMLNWPEDVWIALIPVIPVEHLLRSVVGAIIGVGVIAGLRAIGLVKPREARY